MVGSVGSGRETESRTKLLLTPEMKPRERLAVVGSGASAIYLLKHFLDDAELLKQHFAEISIFEKSSLVGVGMPYSPLTTDRYNLSNISSRELPALTESFGDWLRAQDASMLRDLGVETDGISDSEVYSRLALGKYLNAQYQAITARLNEAGITVREYPACEITDVKILPAEEGLVLLTAKGDQHRFERAIFATGHYWSGEDDPAAGYYTSPWPISKLLPEAGQHHNFAIGTLGASLSAFDVIASLAHRHGTFTEKEKGRMSFEPDPGTEDFKIVMHASHGLLPHLQFDQEQPFREIYRHVDRKGILSLVDAAGFLRIATYFDQVCRPALSEAFAKDKMPDMVKRLAEPDFGLREFVERMTGKHDYENAFEGMRFEMIEARKSVLGHQPIHWKEVIDDLMYTLNFHAELMPAEDHLTLQAVVMPFLMNVIAAMPLPSGNTILALYDAGKLEMVSGRASVTGKDAEKGLTTVTVEEEEGEGSEASMDYRMFVDCSGQKPLELDDYPFKSLVNSGAVRRARAPFADPAGFIAAVPEEKKEHLFQAAGEWVYHIGGIDIEGTYRLIGRDGKPNPRLHDISFPHTTGLRPYSYGLQACSDTSAILVRAWVEEVKAGAPVSPDVREVTRIYEKVQADDLAEN